MGWLSFILPLSPYFDEQRDGSKLFGMRLSVWRGLRFVFNRALLLNSHERSLEALEVSIK